MSKLFSSKLSLLATAFAVASALDTVSNNHFENSSNIVSGRLLAGKKSEKKFILVRETDDLREFFKAQHYPWPHSNPDLFEVLGLDCAASDSTIKTEFRKLSLQYHPDRAETGDEEKFREVNNAYQILSDPKLKAEYEKKRWRIKAFQRHDEECRRVKAERSAVEPAGRAGASTSSGTAAGTNSTGEEIDRAESRETARESEEPESSLFGLRPAIESMQVAEVGDRVELVNLQKSDAKNVQDAVWRNSLETSEDKIFGEIVEVFTDTDEDGDDFHYFEVKIAISTRFEDKSLFYQKGFMDQYYLGSHDFSIQGHFWTIVSDSRTTENGLYRVEPFYKSDIRVRSSLATDGVKEGDRVEHKLSDAEGDTRAGKIHKLYARGMCTVEFDDGEISRYWQIGDNETLETTKLSGNKFEIKPFRYRILFVQGDFMEGMKVTLDGLKSEAGRKVNDHTADVIAYDKQKGRWAVRLDGKKYVKDGKRICEWRGVELDNYVLVDADIDSSMEGERYLKEENLSHSPDHRFSYHKTILREKHAASADLD